MEIEIARIHALEFQLQRSALDIERASPHSRSCCKSLFGVRSCFTGRAARPKMPDSSCIITARPRWGNKPTTHYRQRPTSLRNTRSSASSRSAWFLDRVSGCRRREATGSRSRNTCPTASRLRVEGQSRPQVTAEHQRRLPLRNEVLFRGRPLAGPPLAPERDPRSELLPFANETVYLVMEYERGRTLQEYVQGHKRRGLRALPARRVHAPAQRPARGAFAQAAAPRPEAVQHLPAQSTTRRCSSTLALPARHWPPTSRCSSRCTPPASPRPSTTARARTSARGVTSTVWAPRCTPVMAGSAPQAADERYKKDHPAAGDGALGRPVFRPPAGDHRLVPEPQPLLSPAERLRPAKGAGRGNRVSPSRPAEPEPPESGGWFGRFVDKVQES